MSVFADSGRWPSRVSCSFWPDYHLTFRPLLCLSDQPRSHKKAGSGFHFDIIRALEVGGIIWANGVTGTLLWMVRSN